jgi:uncharacterized HhH-GPD family protein
MTAVDVSFPITFDDDANELLAHDPLALLFGMLLDQQVPMTWAFQVPERAQGAARRPWSPAGIAAMDPEELVESSARSRPCTGTRRPWPAGRTASPESSSSEYDGDTAAIWTTAKSGDELYKRVSSCPGSPRRSPRSSWPSSPSAST